MAAQARLGFKLDMPGERAVAVSASEWLLKPVWDLNDALIDEILRGTGSEWLLKPVWDLNGISVPPPMTEMTVGMAAQARLGFKLGNPTTQFPAETVGMACEARLGLQPCYKGKG